MRPARRAAVWFGAFAASVGAVPAAPPQEAPPASVGVPIRDVADVMGVRDNQLVGYGLVVGLAGTGDGTQARFTVQSLANALQRMGVVVPPSAIRVRNAAAVMVTATLPAFAGPGSKLDVNVASVGDAKSLVGGTLLMTPLRGPDGRVYAVAQGPITLGGAFSAGAAGSSVQKNHPTAGVIPAGGIVERASGVELSGRDGFVIALRRPDFQTAHRVERALVAAFGSGTAHAVDAGRVQVVVPEGLRSNPVEFLALALDVPVHPDVPARVVLNERTGTVVLGGDVRLSRVSITHGNLIVSIASRPEVSQPAPLAAGETVVTRTAEVTTEEEAPASLSLEEGADVADLVAALNKMGVSPRDMIAIFQALRAAGALHADLTII